MPEKSARKKITKKTKLHYDKMLSSMEADVWYKARDFIDILDLKERRIKNLLYELVNDGVLVEDGTTKGKKYKKK